MAVYKVIQDIEAEDKFLGPLTLKQFIFAAITGLCLYLGFLFITKDLWYLTIPLIPIVAIGAFLAFPWGRDQPTEIWLLAKIRFFFKPRIRVWDQSGVQELVTITVPKTENIQYTNNLSQPEVHSRLRALADTIDSRGWAIKNSNINMFTQPGMDVVEKPSDRLVEASSLPQDVPATDIMPADDIMDERNNPVAQQLDEMITQSAETHRQAALEKMNDIRAGGGQDDAAGQNNAGGQGASQNDIWFANQPDPAQTPAGLAMLGGQAYDPDAPISAEEQALLDRLHKDEAVAQQTPIHGHLRVIQPLGKGKTKGKGRGGGKSKDSHHLADIPASAPPPEPPQQAAPPPVTTPLDPAILELAINNDRDVASLAREANAVMHKQPDEVVIKLH